MFRRQSVSGYGLPTVSELNFEVWTSNDTALGSPVAQWILSLQATTKAGHMFPLRCVLCPVDFSEHSRLVLTWAAALAARDEAQLVVASLLEPLLSDAAATMDVLEGLQSDAVTRIDEWIDAIVPPDTPLDRRPVAIARRGKPDEGIIEIAQQYDADLIVMGTHGFTGVRKLLLGSVTAGVLQQTSVPVLAVPYREPRLTADEPGARTLDINRVMVATDLGPLAFDTALRGAELAKSFHAPLTLLHVVAGAPPDEDEHARTARDRVRSIRAARELDELAERLASIVPVDTKQRFGVLADEIGVAAVEMEASIIVMGLVSTGGMFPRRPGSVAYRVMCLSSVPVLVVPPAPSQPFTLRSGDATDVASPQ